MKRLAPITLALLLGACAGELDPLEEEVEQFAAITQSLSLTEACQELDKLCTSSGKGCKAHALFCTQGQGGGVTLPDLGLPAPPSLPGAGSFKQLICSNLQQACASFPLACTIYNNHCAGQGAPAADGGVPWPPAMPDFQLPQLPAMPDFQLPNLPGLPDFQLPSIPGLDRATCCAALDGCIKTSDATCAAAQGVCGPQLPNMPGLPASMQLALIKGIYTVLCSI